MHAPSTAASSHHHADPCCRAHVFTIVKLVNTVLKRQNSMEGRARRHRRRQAVCTRLTAASGRPGSPGDQVAQHYPFSGANHQLASYVWPLHGALSFVFSAATSPGHEAPAHVACRHHQWPWWRPQLPDPAENWGSGVQALWQPAVPACCHALCVPPLPCAGSDTW